MSALRRGVASSAPAILIAVALAGCGGDDDTSAPGSGQGGQGVRLDAPINLADCTDWNEGSAEERLGTIAQIRDFTGGPIPGTNARGSTLSDEEAYDLFESNCANEYARGFKLYKLYGRAAAFSGPNSER